MSTVVGILVYATGKTEPVTDPVGNCIVKRCECCGSELLFEAANKMAEDRSTIVPGSQEEAKFRALTRFKPVDSKTMNGGCIVYIQRRA